MAFWVPGKALAIGGLAKEAVPNASVVMPGGRPRLVAAAAAGETRMQNAIAFCDNDVVVIAWSYGHKVEGCMGFAVYRIDSAGKETALPSMAVSPGFTPKRGQTTLAGAPGSLKPMTISFLVSNEIEIGPLVAPKWRAFFNRGLISTQRVSTALGGMPAKGAARRDRDARRQASRQPRGRHDRGAARLRPPRQGGRRALRRALRARRRRADQRARRRRQAPPPRSLASRSRRASAITNGNAASRARLAKTAGQLIDRMLPNNQIGHNKFVVYVDASGKPAAVLFGSTNWTSTGLCAQTNNTIVCDDAQIARRYHDYWK